MNRSLPSPFHVLCKVLLPLSVVTGGATAHAAKLKVPSASFPGVQVAVDAASPGDVIEIDGGHYREQVLIETPMLTLRGHDGATIDAEYLGACVTVLADDVTIEDLVLANGQLGVFVSADRVRLAGNQVQSSAWNGIQVEGDDAVIVDNEVTGSAGAFIFYLADLAQSVTHIEHNRLRLGHGSDAIFANGGQLIVAENLAESAAGGLQLEPGHGSLRSVVEKNTLLTLGNDAIRVELEEGVAGVEVRGNRVTHIDGDGINLFLAGGNGESIVEGNTIEGVSGDGIQAVVEPTFIAEVAISKNDVLHADFDGVFVSGTGFEVAGNVIERVGRGAGVHAVEFGGSIVGNKVRFASREGIFVDVGVAATVVADNSVRQVGRDAVRILRCDNAVVSGNTVLKNFGDGISIRESMAVQLVGNKCSKNAHEGIDNGGIGSVIDGNECVANGRGFGPDIAGAGNGMGTVMSFQNNKFNNGGADIEQRLDDPGETL